MASTPLLSDAWRLCSHANAAAPGGFLAEVAGGVGYLAFSAVQEAGGGCEPPDPLCGSMVRLDAAANGLFMALKSHVKDEEGERPAMVHAGFLHLFMGLYGNPNFHDQVPPVLLTVPNCRLGEVANYCCMSTNKFLPKIVL